MLLITISHPALYPFGGNNDDVLDVIGLTDFTPGKALNVVLHHSDGSKDVIALNHTYNEQQIGWFRAGSALNLIKEQNKNS